MTAYTLSHMTADGSAVYTDMTRADVFALVDAHKYRGVIPDSDTIDCACRVIGKNPDELRAVANKSGQVHDHRWDAVYCWANS